MIPIPKEPAKGDEILQWALRVNDCLRRLRISGGPGVRVNETGNGLTISADITAKGGSPAAPKLPWEIYDIKSATAGAGMTCKIWPGTIDGVLPTNWDAEFSFDDTLQYWKASAVTDGRNVQSVSIVVDGDQVGANIPVPNALPAAFDVLFAITVDSQVYRVIGPGNPSVRPYERFKTTEVQDGRAVSVSWFAWGLA